LKSTNRSFVILCVGSGAFLALVWLTFDVNFLRALTAAVITMSCVAVLDYFAPQKKMVQMILVAVAAGILIGLGLWWALPYSIPWYYYAIPCVLFACIEALLERWSDRFRKIRT
jgi:hypothetical protein